MSCTGRPLARPWTHRPRGCARPGLWAGLLALACAGCGSGPSGTATTPATAPAASPATSPATSPAGSTASARAVSPTGSPATPPPAQAAPRSPGLDRPGPGPALALPAHRPARNWDDYRHQAALRIVAANPQGSYDGLVPEPLLAIPVLEIELNADGSVRRISVLRRPRQALDTVQLAIDAVHRAAPFAPVGSLPRPWKFAEVFLFDEQRRFKPRTLDL